MECTLNGDKIACGKNQKALSFNKYHPEGSLKPTGVVSAAKEGLGLWSIGPDNSIKWQISKEDTREVYFSLSKVSSNNEIFGDVCTTLSHPDGANGVFSLWITGKPKAIFSS
jgi:hypothetical protein